MIVIMRHGEAAYTGKSSQRVLTPSGRIFVNSQALILQKIGISFNCALCSPLIRAQETLEILSNQVPVHRIQIVEDLLPQGNDLVADYLQVMEEESGPSILAVSHLPLVEILVESLTGSAHVPAFYPGYCCILKKEPCASVYKVTWSTKLS